MTATKAFAATIAAELVVVASWALTQVPGWTAMPMNVQASITAIVVAVIGFGVTYYAPANVTVNQGE